MTQGMGYIIAITVTFIVLLFVYAFAWLQAWKAVRTHKEDPNYKELTIADMKARQKRMEAETAQIKLENIALEKGIEMKEHNLSKKIMKNLSKRGD